MKFLFFTLPFLIPLLGISQSSLSKDKWPIRYVRPNGYCEKIEFYDTLSNRLIKSVNLVDNDPYNKFPYKIIKHSSNYLNYYELPDSVRSKTDYWVTKNHLQTKTKNVTPGFVTSTIGYSNDPSGGGYAAVAYNLVTYNTENITVGIHSTYLIFNSKGDVIRTFEHLPSGAAGYVEISKDGKYLLISSKTLVDSSQEIGKPMIEIYDINDKKKVYSEIIPEADDMLFPQIVNHNMFKIDVNLFENGDIIKVFDIINNIKYEKRYTQKEFQSLIRIESNGILFKGENGHSYFDKFTDYPKQTLIK
jgi:hypothetical protein